MVPASSRHPDHGALALPALRVALACHTRLALTRPSSRYLTQFYLLLSVGGVLGGLCNALIAPLVFSSLAEYPLVMALACLLLAGPRPAQAWTLRSIARDAALAVVVGAAALVFFSDVFMLRLDTGVRHHAAQDPHDGCRPVHHPAS